MAIIFKSFECYPRGGVSAVGDLVINGQYPVTCELYPSHYRRQYSVRLSRRDKEGLKAYCKSNGFEFSEIMEDIHDAMLYRFRKKLRHLKSGISNLDKSRIDRKEGRRIHQKVIRSYSSFRRSQESN